MYFKFILFLLFISFNSFSYSNFIGYGYTSCLTCHYNPLGNGPLNDYGRALGSNLIAGKLFLPVSDEKLANNAGFLGSMLNDKPMIRPSLDYRGMRYTTNFLKDNSNSEIIHMQVDANLVLRFNEDKVIFSGTYGLAPGDDGEQTAYSRELYLGYRLSDNKRILLGKTDKAFGIRLPDHILGGRKETSLQHNDQTVGATFHSFTEKYEYGVQYFIGDLLSVKDSAKRQKGFSGMFEYGITEKSRLGASYMKIDNEGRKRNVMAAHLRSGFSKGVSLMAEFGMNNYEEVLSQTKYADKYFFIQNMMKITRGLHALATVDYYQKNNTTANEKSSVLTNMIGLQYFPMPRIEMRLDLSNTRGLSSRGEDFWTLMQQLHLWF